MPWHLTLAKAGAWDSGDGKSPPGCATGCEAMTQVSCPLKTKGIENSSLGLTCGD